MYLHYYLNQKYVGPVDIEVFFDTKHKKDLVVCSEDCANHLLGLELVYGKKIPSISRAEAFDLQHGGNRSNPYAMSALKDHVYTTKKCGPFLAWSDYERVLMCKL